MTCLFGLRREKPAQAERCSWQQKSTRPEMGLREWTSQLQRLTYPRNRLKYAESEARRQGFGSIYLYTHEKMTENQTLYLKIGYVEYDRRLENGFPRVYMRKNLE
jgi:hypothetical protein